MFRKLFNLHRSKKETHQNEIYETLFKKHGYSPLSLHWSNAKNQRNRFDALLGIGDLNHKSVLDIGCGFGDLLSHLKRNGIVCNYTGYDVVEDFIKVARQMHPDAPFELRNVLSDPSEKKFDYILLSGTFAFGDLPFFQNMLKFAFEACQIAVGFNIHITHDPRFFFISKTDVQLYCQSLQPGRIIFKENYLPQDFSCFVYR